MREGHRQREKRGRGEWVKRERKGGEENGLRERQRDGERKGGEENGLRERQRETEREKGEGRML